MRVVHGPGFRLCVFGYNRFWAQKKNRPRHRNDDGASIENRTTRGLRRYDLLETSLPDQHDHQQDARRCDPGRGLLGSHHLLGLLVEPSNRRSVPRQR